MAGHDATLKKKIVTRRAKEEEFSPSSPSAQRILLCVPLYVVLTINIRNQFFCFMAS